ncbi:MAG TPA: glycerol kinase GlpK [Alphaproteobacteria bacterium]|nr:glycerol kinase GlpK [Alphaproteobacteria bacterium]HNS44405.1 glycerol kinase GlpK [Alphaproteobacteria bacterium]
MTQPKFLSVDQGTTSSRAIVFTADGTPLATAQKELKLHYPQNGWVEQNADDIWSDTLHCVREVIKQHADITAFGITNQRETTILWNRETGKPVYNAIVWQDRRTAEECAKLKRGGYEQKIVEKTGLLLDPYFSATKIKWILGHIEGAAELARDGKLAFGTVDSFLLWKLTGGKVHATDATNASRTMLYNIRTHEWDEELLHLFGIPRTLLPEVKDNVADFGTTQDDLLEKPYPVRGMAGDQQAALIGQACFETGMVKSTYGTGCFALMNIGEEFKVSQNKLVTSIGYRIGGKTNYVLEGSIFVAGAAIQFLRDNLGFFASAAESEKLAEEVKDNGGVYFVPALTGLGAPYWNPNARGAILGLARDSTRAHIARAALEAQAYQTKDLMDAFVKDSGIDPAIIRVDGGLVANVFMVKFLSDMLDRTVEIPSCAETTALGAAYLAALGSGTFKNLEDIAGNWNCAKRYTPSMDAVTRETLYTGWKKAVGVVNHASSNI